MDDKRTEAINRRLKQMPVSCRKLYKKAVNGNSLRACVDSQCLECTGYDRDEVRNCTDLGCPLYAVRPYQEIRKNTSGGHILGRKSMNLENRS